jgi:GGDEF domain-containing protein
VLLLLDNVVDFQERARQELARAQRYCLYLSLLILDLPAPEGTAAQAPEGQAQNLLRYIDSVVRVSDLVAAPIGNKLALLLVETPDSGLSVVADRVCTFIADFFESEVGHKTPAELSLSSAVYPDATTDFKRLLESLKTRRQIVN